MATMAVNAASSPRFARRRMSGSGWVSAIVGRPAAGSTWHVAYVALGSNWASNTSATEDRARARGCGSGLLFHPRWNLREECVQQESLIRAVPDVGEDGRQLLD